MVRVRRMYVKNHGSGAGRVSEMLANVDRYRTEGFSPGLEPVGRS